MLVLMIFLTSLSLIVTCVGGYLFAVYVVRNRPDSALGQVLTKISHFQQYLEQGKVEVERDMAEVRQRAKVDGAEDDAHKIWSFRECQAPNDSMRVMFPDTDRTLVMRVVGTMRMWQLWQENESSRTNPWSRWPESPDLVFQVLRGARNAWIFELPNKALALVYDIQSVDATTIETIFVAAAKRFGASKQTARDCEVEWEGGMYRLTDIGSMGAYGSAGETPWRAASASLGKNVSAIWPMRDQLKFLIAGPRGGKSAPHNPRDVFLAVVTPKEGNQGYVLTGQIIDPQWLKEVGEEG